MMCSQARYSGSGFLEFVQNRFVRNLSDFVVDEGLIELLSIKLGSSGK